MWQQRSSSPDLEASLPALSILSPSTDDGTNTPSMRSTLNTPRTRDLSEIDDTILSPLPFRSESILHTSESFARANMYQHQHHESNGIQHQNDGAICFENQYPHPHEAIPENEDFLNPLSHTSQLSNHERATLALDLQNVHFSDDEELAVKEQQNQEGLLLEPAIEASLNVSVHSIYSQASQSELDFITNRVSDLDNHQRGHRDLLSPVGFVMNNVSNHSVRSAISFGSQHQRSLSGSGHFGLDQCIRPGFHNSSTLDDGSLHHGANASTHSVRSEASSSYHRRGRFIRNDFLSPAIPQQQSFGVENFGPSFGIPPQSSHSVTQDPLGESMHSWCSSLAGHFQGVGIDDLSQSRRSTDYDSCYTAGTEEEYAFGDRPLQIPRKSLSRSEHSTVFQFQESFREDDEWDGFGDVPEDAQGIPEQEWGTRYAPGTTMTRPNIDLGVYPTNRHHVVLDSSNEIVSPKTRKKKASAQLDFSSQQPLELTDSDVLAGQGTGSAGRPSNQMYLEKVRELQGKYWSLEERDSRGKTAIALRVYDFVHKELGGRFVTRKEEYIFELPKKYVIGKIKRALRDKPKPPPTVPINSEQDKELS